MREWESRQSSEKLGFYSASYTVSHFYCFWFMPDDHSEAVVLKHYFVSCSCLGYVSVFMTGICKSSLQTENTEMNSLSIVHHGVMSKVKEPDPEQLSWSDNYFTRSCEAQLDQQYGLQVVKTMCRKIWKSVLRAEACWERDLWNTMASISTHSNFCFWQAALPHIKAR